MISVVRIFSSSGTEPGADPTPLWAFSSVLLVALLSFVCAVQDRELWNPMEPRYAGIASEMARTEQWLIPEYQGRPYTQKPPLLFWCSALLLRWLGEDQRLLAIRLPSALAGVLLAVGTYLLGLRLLSVRAAMFAGWVIATSWMPFLSSRFLHMDTALGAATVFTLLGWWAASSSSGKKRAAFIVLAGVALGAGALIKGPLAALFPLLAFGVSALWSRDPRRVLRAGMLPSLALGSLLALAWLIPAHFEAGSAFTRELVLGQGVLRHGSDRTDRNGVLFYLSGVLGSLAPWGLFLPFAAYVGWRERNVERMRPTLHFAMTWIFLSILVLSFASMRRSRYLIPVLPAAAMLIGWWLDRAVGRSTERWPRVFTASIGAIVAVVLAPPLLVPMWAKSFVANESPLTDAFNHVVAQGWLPFTLGTLILLLGTWTVFASVRCRLAAALLGATITLCSAAVTFGFVLGPATDHFKNDKPLVALLRGASEAGARVILVGDYAFRESTAGYFTFYRGVPPSLFRAPCEELTALANDPRSLVFVRARDMEKGLPHPGVGWRLALENPIGVSDLRVYESDRADAASSWVRDFRSVGNGR